MRLPAAARRQQLLDVALTTFAERGYHEASMNQIAKAAGVTKPVLYQHFESKRSLYRELLTELGTELQGEIGAATVDATGPRQQIELGFRAYFQWVDERPGAFRLLFGGDTRRDPEFAGQIRQVEGAIASFVAALIQIPDLSEPDRDLLAHGLVGMAEATCRRWRAALSTSPATESVGFGAPERLAAQVSELAWFGLRGIRPASNFAAPGEPYVAVPQPSGRASDDAIADSEGSGGTHHQTFGTRIST